MKPTLLLCITLLATACTCTHNTCPTTASKSITQPTIVYINDPDTIIWNGWAAHLTDIPRLVQEYHSQSVVIRASKGTFVNYTDATKVRDALLQAGVKEVQIGAGGLGE